MTRRRFGHFLSESSYRAVVSKRRSENDGQTETEHLQCKASHEQEERHKRERDKEEISTTKRVDGIYSRECHDEVQGTKAPRCEQSLDLREVGLREYGGRIVGDNVDSAELLPGIVVNTT